MRLLLLAIALLAGAKVFTQDRVYRSVTGEVIAAAYRDRAAQTCHKVPSRAQKAATNPWGSAASAEVTIGDRGANVAMWDFDNPLWDVRFRHPHLVLTTGSGEPMSCFYDLTVGFASVRPR